MNKPLPLFPAPAAPPQSAPARTRILEILAGTAGWRSGEDISAALGISRAAVAKHVAALRADGHAIDAATRRGYMLRVLRERLDGDDLAARLGTRRFGKQGWRILEETESTNLDAAALARSGTFTEGYVVFAERQSAGRGRKGNSWLSLPRGVQFSVLLRPDAAHWNAEDMTAVGARAVAAAVRECCGLDAVFKQPNDVFVNGRKLSGVLVETAMRGTEPEWAVLGIGCNVNALPEDFPAESAGRFTSLLGETGVVQDRARLLIAILEKLEQGYDAMQAGEREPFAN
ncbi:biotin--[acetyl-CoA-carboxylase] ligase [Desulfovibrio sp. OttesenSCG-928-I05]|nr:biotin--[acetyl-CoA-carboxylase] ligase [Desulfovibrio sp. OttesenSCG-928-I05]